MLRIWVKRAFDGIDRSLKHWVWAIPVLLFVTAMSARQLDLVVPAADEYRFMLEAGLIDGALDSPPDGLASVGGRAGSLSPLYVIVLNLWGSLAGQEIAMLRALSVFTGLLSLAMICRLARDFVAPMARLLALFVLASNAFYNFYHASVGLSPPLMLAGAFTLWLYLRLCRHNRRARTSDYLALAAAGAALVSTHVFSALLLVALGAYHLLHVRKDRRWLRISLALAAGLLLIFPWLSVLVTAVIDQTDTLWQAESSNLGQILGAWYDVGFNGSVILLLTAGAGLILGWRQRTIAVAQPMLIGFYFLVLFSLAALLSETAGIDAARLAFGGWSPFLLVIAGGLYGLYRWRRWLAVVVVLWIAAGVSFQAVADWGALIVERALPFEQPAWHLVSRLARQSQPTTPILPYLVDLAPLHDPTHFNYPQSRHYFAEQDLELVTAEDFDAFKNYVFQHSHVEPRVSIFYRRSTLDAIGNEGPDSVMTAANYRLCEQQEIGVDTVLTSYAWRALDCLERQLLAASETDLIRYEFYGAAVEMSRNQILFAHRWTALDSFPPERYNLSHQLISADWERVAQLDPPLTQEGSLRQFSMDISSAPAGKYRLMAILYDNQTNERFDWIGNSNQPPYMLALADVEIPE